MAVEFTVGRHAADDDAGVHPLVAAALEAREAPATGTHRFDRPALAGSPSDGEGGLGWPGTPGDGSGGLGWPGSPGTGGGGLGWPGKTGADAHRPPETRRSGWRRLLGGGERSRRRSTAA